MELNFVQSSEVFGKNTLAWETEFTVDKEFNLHLERVKGGEIMMMQRTSGTFFDVVEDFHMNKGDIIYDYDSAPFLGTKTIKIVSVSAIRFAAVTTDGEITEIKSQSKEVEVTSNGTMDITPDAGFAYLNSVKVKTNVAGSGEGGGSASGDWEYFDVGSTVGSSDNRSISMYAAYFAGLVKLVEYRDEVVTAKQIGTIMYAFASADYDYYSQLAINMATTCVNRDGVYTLRESIEQNPNSQLAQIYSALSSFPRITEEEFYNLDNGGGIA